MSMKTYFRSKDRKKRMNTKKEGYRADNLFNRGADDLIDSMKGHPDEYKKILNVLSAEEVDAIITNLDTAGRKDVADGIRGLVGIVPPDKGTIDTKELLEDWYHRYNGWSFSKHRLWNLCKRAYYYRYIGTALKESKDLDTTEDRVNGLDQISRFLG